MGANLILIFSGFTTLILFYILAIAVITSNPRSWSNRSFFMYFTTKSLAVITTIMIPLSLTFAEAMFNFRLFTASLILFSTYLYLFGYSLEAGRESVKKRFFALSGLALLLVVPLFLYDGFYVLRAEPYGWYYDYTVLGYLYAVGYYAAVEGLGIYLVIRFMRRIVNPEIKRYLKFISLSFIVHYFLGPTIVIGQRLLSTAEFDLLWTVPDVALFGIALYYFLKLKMRD